MYNNTILTVFVLCCVGIRHYQCLKLIPERGRLIYYDENYFTNGTLNVRRLRRGGDYIVNLNFTIMQTIGNNVKISVYFYEYLHNEYKPSFVQLHYKLCDMILNDNLIGVIVRRGGLVNCPMIPGVYAMKNLYFNQKIPSVWPFEKGMFQAVASHDAKLKGIIAKGEVMISLEDNVPSGTKQPPVGKPMG